MSHRKKQHAPSAPEAVVPDETKATEPQANPESPLGNVMAYLFIAAILGGMLWYIGGTVRLFLRTTQQNAWPGTTGTVQKATYSTARSASRGRITPWYYPSVSYTYTVRDRAFTGHIYRNYPNNTISHDEAEAVVRAYPPGRQVIVHYNPANPQESYLVSSALLLWDYLGAIVMTIFFVAIGGSLLAIKFLTPSASATRQVKKSLRSV